MPIYKYTKMTTAQPDQVNEHLDAWAQQGWELMSVQVVPMSAANGGSYWEHHFFWTHVQGG
jgi:hypothetical protein